MHIYTAVTWATLLSLSWRECIHFTRKLSSFLVCCIQSCHQVQFFVRSAWLALWSVALLVIWGLAYSPLYILATTALRASAARSGSEGIRHFKIRFLNCFNCAHFLPFEKIEKVWQSGKFCQGDWKSMKKWPILRWRLKNYENLVVTYDKETEKVCKSGQF